MTGKIRKTFKSVKQQPETPEKTPKKSSVKMYNKADEVEDIPIRGFKKYKVVEFQSVDEFNDFHKKHLDELEADTTTVLNRKYKIPGFIISRATQKIGKDEEGNDITKKILTLRRDGRVSKLKEEEKRLIDIEEKIDEFDEKISKMTDAINTIGEQLNALIKFVSDE